LKAHVGASVDSTVCRGESLGGSDMTVGAGMDPTKVYKRL
jgi:hypothetical protein